MRLLFATLAALVGVSASAQIDLDATVRVRLMNRTALTEATVEPLGDALSVHADDRFVGTLDSGARLTLSQGGVSVRARFGGSEDAGQTVRVSGGDFRIRAGGADRRYTGSLVVHVVDGKIRLVNHVPIEPYVASVVASEFNFREIEGAKAQAVLARTYAARRFGAHTHRDLADDQTSQVYRGLETVTPTSERAARETAGQVLTYRGSLADAYYFSSSGGHTADNEAVWNGAPIPYLRGVPDPYDTAAPDHDWQTSASRSAILRALSSRYGGSVQGVEIATRSRSGRVLRIRLLGGRREHITGDQFRRAVNAVAGWRTVRSTQFDIRVEGDRYVFVGGGFGHGVGMSQFGALGQARDGRDYQEILAYYFIGTEVSGAGTLPGRPVLIAQVPVVEDAEVTVRERASSLRTRYRPASGRRWPTPRGAARQAQRAADSVPVAEAARADAPAQAPAPRRRTAW